mgnify:CR=1 FL=1
MSSTIDPIDQCIADWTRAATSKERSEVVQCTARLLGCTVATVYRRMRRKGWTSGRKKRKDAGSTTLTATELDTLTKLQASAVNKRGRPNLPLTEALRMAQEKGRVRPDISYAQVARVARANGRGPTQLRAREAAVARSSTYPNHVWFVDISVALQWHLKDGDGKRISLRENPELLYEGKREKLASLREVLHRYTVVDHCSGAFYVQYYYSAGENAYDVVDFLCRAMSPKRLPGGFPFRGVPKRLVVDQGSAFKNYIVRNLAAGLGVEVEMHAPTNAKASGAVETRHRHWQASFESRLAQTHVSDLAALNQAAEDFAAVIQAERPLVRARTKKPPMERWVTISDDQLVEAPSRQVFMQLAAGKLEERVVDAYLRIRFENSWFELSGEQPIWPGQRVKVQRTPMLEVAVRVWDELDREYAVTEISFNEHGFAENGRSHEWDNEERAGATVPQTAAKKAFKAHKVAVKEGNQAPLDLGGLFDDLSRKVERQEYLRAREGTAWTPASSAAVDGPPLSSLDARERVVARLGRGLTREEGRWWRERLGEGVTEARLDELYTKFTASPAADRSQRTG